MVAVYRPLSANLKQRIAALRVIHHQCQRHIEVEIARNGASLPLQDRKVGRIHPLVRRHMATIEPSLYLPTRRDSLIVGYTEEDSRALLEQLWATVNDAPCVVGVALLPGDFIIWDNVACAHSREGWPADQGRLVWHVSAEGEIPTPRYSKKVVNTIGMDRTAALEANKATYVSAI